MFFCTIIKKNLFQTKDTANHPVPFEVLMIVIKAKSGADGISTDQNVKIMVIIDFIYQGVRTNMLGTYTAPYFLFCACMEHTHRCESYFLWFALHPLQDVRVFCLNKTIAQIGFHTQRTFETCKGMYLVMMQRSQPLHLWQRALWSRRFVLLE